MVEHPDPWRQSSLIKPRYRGWMHTLMIPVAVIGGVVVVAVARSHATRVAALVFALVNLFMFVTSAVFNRRWWSDHAWRVMRQIDQTAIYLVIGGTFTGLVGVAPDGDVRWWRLALIWTGTLAGVALRWADFELPVGMQSSLFVALGLLAGLSIPLLFEQVSNRAGWLVVIGGLAYLVGVIVLGLRRPDPWPRTFGYHEIWHVMVTVGVVLHYVAVVEVVS